MLAPVVAMPSVANNDLLTGAICQFLLQIECTPVTEGTPDDREPRVRTSVQPSSTAFRRCPCRHGKICQVAKRSLDDADDSFEALSEVIFGEDGQKRGQWAFIQLDWKATEEIVWQVTEILSVLGIEDRWVRDCNLFLVSSSIAASRQRQKYRHQGVPIACAS